METQDFLRDAVIHIEKALEKNEENISLLFASVSSLRGEIKVLDSRVASAGRLSSVIWGALSAAVFHIMTLLMSSD